MVTIESSESLAEAEYLRSQRTLSVEQVEKRARQHDIDDVSAEERWSAVAHA
jgi:hypothetical protein